MRTKRTAVEVAQQVWAGSSGFDRIRGTSMLASPSTAAFRAERRRLVVDGVDLADWRCSPLAGRGPVAADTDPDSPRIVAVLSGAFRYWADLRAHEGVAGSLHLLPGARDTRFSVPVHSALLCVVLPRDLVSPTILTRVSASCGPLRSSPLTTGFVALAEQVLERSGARADSPAAHAIRSLAAAVLEESMPEPEDLDLRDLILRHIERHLGEPDLDPRRIADHFEISLRWVHHVFDVDGVSLARYIRERRTDMVAARLRADQRRVRIDVLAAQHGFAGRDQLSRAFRARYGLTIAGYADAVAEDRPLPAPRGLADAVD